MAAGDRGTAFLAAPVSGNGKVGQAGLLSVVVSGPRDAFEAVEYLIAMLGRHVSYVGEGELARLAKICHNLLLGVVAQNLAEITVLAEKAGMPRASFLDFINNSVMGSMFTRYKSPALVHLDFTPTFTPVLLQKDFDLGLAAARELEVPMPVSAAAREQVQSAVARGRTQEDFAVLLELQAANSVWSSSPRLTRWTTGSATRTRPLSGPDPHDLATIEAPCRRETSVRPAWRCPHSAWAACPWPACTEAKKRRNHCGCWPGPRTWLHVSTPLTPTGPSPTSG